MDICLEVLRFTSRRTFGNLNNRLAVGRVIAGRYLACFAQIRFPSDVSIRAPIRPHQSARNFSVLSVGVYVGQVIMTLAIPGYLSGFTAIRPRDLVARELNS